MQIVETAIGFANAIAYVVNYAIDFITNILPTNIASMFGIAFTVIVAVAVKRGVVN